MLRLLVLIAACFTLGTPCAPNTLPTMRLRPLRPTRVFLDAYPDARFWPTRDRFRARAPKNDPVEAALFNLGRSTLMGLE